MVVSGLDQAEQLLLAGDLPCPHCRAVLRPFGRGRPRVVRGLGSARLRLTPRRARCAACRRTQILLPAARALLQFGSDDEKQFMGQLLQVYQGLGAGRIMDDSVRVRWFRGP